MDKRVIFAVAGSGKTTRIVDTLARDKRSLIVTYTEANCLNLREQILKKFDGLWPENITLMTYFTFLYRFCYKPFLSDNCKAVGICYDQNLIQPYLKKENRNFYMTSNRHLYSNRLSFLLEECGVVPDIQERITTYFDEFIIDEVQDIAGRDFNFLEKLMGTNVNILFVGDFYQHTFDTSRDGRVNTNLFDNISAYQKRFATQGLIVDTDSLKGSWRCSKSVCDYIRVNLGISIFTARPDTDDTLIQYVSEKDQIGQILKDEKIIKLHYQQAIQFGIGHKNWGATKGENHGDVCVLLNSATAKKRAAGRLSDLPPLTKNKLYVAITRAKGNVYLIDEKECTSN